MSALIGSRASTISSQKRRTAKRPIERVDRANMELRDWVARRICLPDPTKPAGTMNSDTSTSRTVMPQAILRGARYEQELPAF
jgi:hypothetical protein